MFQVNVICVSVEKFDSELQKQYKDSERETTTFIFMKLFIFYSFIFGLNTEI